MFKSKGILSNVLKTNGSDKTRAVSALNRFKNVRFKNVFGVFHFNRTAKACVHMIVRIVPVVSNNNVQTIETIILKRYPDDRKRPGRLRNPRSLGYTVDRVEFHSDDRDDRVNFEAIIWKRSQMTETIGTIEGYLRNHHFYSSNRE